MPAFKVTLARKVGDIEQQGVVLLTAKSKKAAGDIALGRAEEGDGKIEWTPTLAEGIMVPDDADITVLTVENHDGPVEERPDPSQDTVKTQAANPGTAGGMARATPDLPGTGTHGIRVNATTGTHEQLTTDQLAQQREQGRKDDAPPKRPTSDPKLDAPPGCGGVKNAMGNDGNRLGAIGDRNEGGRLLDVHSEGHDTGDVEAKEEGALETAQQQTT